MFDKKLRHCADCDVEVDRRDFLTATAGVAAAATADLVNTASVAVPAGVVDPDAANDTATDTDTAAPSSDLVMAKVVDNPGANVGDNVTFTLTVTNNGPSDATGVAVSDLLPSGYTYVSDDGAGAYVSGTGVWTVGNLVATATATLNITATVNASGDYTNVATVSGDQADPDAMYKFLKSEGRLDAVKENLRSRKTTDFLLEQADITQ